MPTPDSKQVALKWMAGCIFGFSLFLMLAVSAILFHSAAFSDRLAQIAGHPVGEHARLAISLGTGLAAEFAVMGLAYLLFPRTRDAT
jgi:hypothetical protein